MLAGEFERASVDTEAVKPSRGRLVPARLEGPTLTAAPQVRDSAQGAWRSLPPDAARWLLRRNVVPGKLCSCASSLKETSRSCSPTDIEGSTKLLHAQAEGPVAGTWPA